MQFARRTRSVVALSVFTAVYGVVLDRPIVLAGTVLVGAWLVGRQSAFIASIEDVIEALSVGQTAERTNVRPTETDRVHLEAQADPGRIPDRCRVSVTAGVPMAARANESLVVDLDGDAAHASTDVTWPIAGRHRFDPMQIDVDDGWFRETVTAGDQPTVTVEPPGPHTIHVGKGGESVSLGDGNHESDARGAGVELTNIREYIPGDDKLRIDWNATARLDTPHVRESQLETDRRTAIVIDARSSLAIRPRDETALDHLTDVALAIVANARQLDDPIGLVTVDDGGVGTRIPTSAATETGVRVRRALLDLEPVSTNDPTPRSTTAADARVTGAALDGDDAFSQTLTPFYTDREAYVKRVESEPLFAAVTELLSHESGTLWTIILTDDTNRAELGETVAKVRSHGGEVLVAMAPQSLYEPDDFANAERAYERYVDFDAFRQRLGRQSGVTALEVGPEDRLATLLGAGRASRRDQPSGRSRSGERP